MKTDLNSLKKELKRLADVDVLKKELNRLAKEIKNFDLSQALTPQAKARVDKLEARFMALKAKLQDVQVKADETFEKFRGLVRRTAASATKSKSSRGSSKKTSKKAAPKTGTSKKKASATRKTTKKAATL